MQFEDKNDANKPFNTRSILCKILQTEFNLNEIFDESKNSKDQDISIDSSQNKALSDYNWRLTYLICFTINHFISFIRSEKDWYICEDSDTILLGNSSDLFFYLNERGLFPYIVFYQTCDDEPSDTPKLNETVPDSNNKDEAKEKDESVEIIDVINKGQANEINEKLEKASEDSERKEKGGEKRKERHSSRKRLQSSVSNSSGKDSSKEEYEESKSDIDFGSWIWN